jgi:hypothetical protein
MADEPAKLILGDTAISAIEQPPGHRGFLRRKDRQSRPLSHCENCGARLVGHYCAQCGQPASIIAVHSGMSLSTFSILF